MILNPKLKCLILAGDNKQLPSTVISKLAETNGYGRSLYDRLLYHNFPSTLLNIQYRMHPEISLWPNAEFYQKRIIDGPNVKSDSYKKYYHDLFPPFSVYDIQGCEELSAAKSRSNGMEVSVVNNIIKHIYERILLAADTDNNILKIGILSPYDAQVQLINNKIKSMNEKCSDKMQLICRTIDGFQGQECDIIILTTVRSNKEGKLGFLTDLRRLNVAITRSKFSLIIVCNYSTISNNHTWKRLIDSTDYIATAETSLIVRKVILRHQKYIKDIQLLQEFNSDIFEKTLWSGKIKLKDTFRKSFPLIKSNGTFN